MSRPPAADFLLLPVAVVVVVVLDVALPFLKGCGRRVVAWRPLLPLRRLLARLPAMAALTLFLVPELCSRAGTVASAWLLLQGDWWRAVAVYAATKLFAGGLALWIYTACEPALLRSRLFATVHGAVASLRQTVMASLPNRAGRSGRFATLCHRVRTSGAIRSVVGALQRLEPTP